jgi:uncharacterized protein (DUF736 family)
MQLIGNLEISKKTKNGKLLIAIPFWNKVDFFVSNNSEKKSDSSPDFFIWNQKIKIGALWKKVYTKEGIDKKYFSGNIFAPMLGKDNKIKIVIFENEKENSSLSDITTGNVFWSMDEKKGENPIDSEPIQEQSLEDEIF